MNRISVASLPSKMRPNKVLADSEMIIVDVLMVSRDSEYQTRSLRLRLIVRDFGQYRKRRTCAATVKLLASRQIAPKGFHLSLEVGSFGFWGDTLQLLQDRPQC